VFGAGCRPRLPRRHIAVTLPGPCLEAAGRPTYACFHVPGGKRLPGSPPGRARHPESAYRRSAPWPANAVARRPGGSDAARRRCAAAELQEASAMIAQAESATPTIYDVARAAGVSIASVSRVLNGRRNPSPEIRDRVQRAASELGYVPDSAARALSVRLKEVVGVVMRRPLSAGSPIPAPVLSAGMGGAWDTAGLLGYDAFADETESLQFHDMLNRGVERAAQRRGFDLLLRSVDITDHEAGRRVLAVARKSDGLILHDGLLEPGQIDEISRRVPIVTL